MLPPGLGLTQQAVQRFQREAHAAAKLHHTGIVPVYATGEEAGCHYYAMELIEGQPLSEVLRDLTGQGSNPLMDETVTRLGGDAPAESKPDAIEQLDRAIELDPGHAAALLARAQRHVDRKDFPAALRDGERLAAIRPRSAQGRRMIAWVHYNLHDPERALAEYERAIELDAEYAVYHRERADAHYKLGQYEEAIRDARRALELDPNDLAAYSTWGYACLWSGRREEIQLIVEQLTAALADWTDRRALADGLMLIAAAEQAVGAMEQALAKADRAIEVAPDYYQVYFWRAWLLRRTGNVRGAEAEVIRAADVELSKPGELLLRGFGFSQGGQHDLAFADLDRAVELAPNWADPYHRRAHLNEELGRLEESLADYDRSISLAPRWVELLADRGRIHGAMERFDAALADFETALEIDGQHAATLLNRADVQLRMGRIDAALADIERAVELNPDNAWAQATRARALLLGGRVDEAVAAIDLAIEREPGNPHFYPRRASYRLYGEVDCSAAVADLDRARELAPPTWIEIPHAIARIQVTDLAVVCPQSFDAAIALESARRAADLMPRYPEPRLTLGLALYRHGRFREARDELLRAGELRIREPEPRELFALAMTEWKLGNESAARKHYERGVTRMVKPFPDSLRDNRFKNEASELLGIEP